MEIVEIQTLVLSSKQNKSWVCEGSFSHKHLQSLELAWTGTSSAPKMIESVWTEHKYVDKTQLDSWRQMICYCLHFSVALGFETMLKNFKTSDTMKTPFICGKWDERQTKGTIIICKTINFSYTKQTAKNI